MKMIEKKMFRAICVVFPLYFFLMTGCVEKAQDNNESWDIASPEYSSLAEQAMNHMAELDFDAWGDMLADDIEYYFPDGDADTRTVLTGKETVLNWWKNWSNTSGIESMTFSNSVFLPVIAQETPNYAGLTGPYVVSYFSNRMVYDGKPVNVRMNMTVHFNESDKIDRYYTYYDRTPIIETVNTNILETEADTVGNE